MISILESSYVNMSANKKFQLKYFHKLGKFVKAWDNKNCFPVELLKINEYEPRKSLISINIYIYLVWIDS